MQRAEHLLRECGGDRGLRLAALLQQRRQPAILGIGEQPGAPSSSFSPPSIGRPATVASGRSGNAEPARGLAARRIDQAQHAAVMSRPAGTPSRAAGARNAGGRRLPAIERPRASGSIPAAFDADEELPALPPSPTRDGPCRLQAWCHAPAARQRAPPGMAGRRAGCRRRDAPPSPGSARRRPTGPRGPDAPRRGRVGRHLASVDLACGKAIETKIAAAPAARQTRPALKGPIV